jgi:hypothetical protein
MRTQLLVRRLHNYRLRSFVRKGRSWLALRIPALTVSRRRCLLEELENLHSECESYRHDFEAVAHERRILRQRRADARAALHGVWQAVASSQLGDRAAVCDALLRVQEALDPLDDEGDCIY